MGSEFWKKKMSRRFFERHVLSRLALPLEYGVFVLLNVDFKTNELPILGDYMP